MKDHVMVDLETLGSNSFSVILSIGAVKFDMNADPDADDAYDTFHAYVDPGSCVAHGLQMDTSTVMWWLAQSKESQEYQTKAQRVSLPDALEAFSAWIGMPKESDKRSEWMKTEAPKVWGNGATFDNVILSNAYRACGMEQPWPFWGDRCYRTLKGLVPELKIERLGTHHNALHDAMSQARHLQKLMAKLGLANPPVAMDTAVPQGGTV